jgi:hypothetical protein
MEATYTNLCNGTPLSPVADFRPVGLVLGLEECLERELPSLDYCHRQKSKQHRILEILLRCLQVFSNNFVDSANTWEINQQQGHQRALFHTELVTFTVNPQWVNSTTTPPL